MATEEWLEQNIGQEEGKRYTQEQVQMLAEAIEAGETPFPKEKGEELLVKFGIGRKKPARWTEKQKKVVSTKLTELQYYAIRKRAGEAGLRISEYVRQAVISAEVIPRLNRQDADTIRKLAGEANNINQLAHRANAGGFALVAVELVKLKNRIVEIINQLSDDWKNKKGKRI